MSLHEHIAPVLLTFQEAPNIERTLASLRWAPDVVVVDSGSTDGTADLARQFDNVRVFVRPFDNHRAQWTFGLRETGINVPFVLALDADMQVSDALRRELEGLPDEVDFNGAMLPFDYCIWGESLGGSLLGPQLRLLRRSALRVEQVGHTQRFHTGEPIVDLAAPLIHDDRKPLEDFVRSQSRYSNVEWSRLKALDASRLSDRVRQRAGLIGTVAICGYTALRIGWRKPAQRRYWLERAMFELMLAYRREQEALANS